MRPLGVCLLALPLLPLAAAAQPPEAPTEIRLTPAAPASPASTPDEVRARLLALLNAERAKLGLAALAPDPALDRAAQRHADDMVAKGYFALVSPSGEDVDGWLAEEGYLGAVVGEKLVQAPAARTPEELAAGWGAARASN